MQAPAHSLKYTQHAIKRAFDASVEELFDEFDGVPVASGSIGQVYRAMLSAKGARNTGIDAGAHMLHGMEKNLPHLDRPLGRAQCLYRVQRMNYCFVEGRDK